MPRRRAFRLLVTCEHAGNRVPARYCALFEGRDALLASHRGWDPHALGLARRVARAAGAPLLVHETTRLLVEPNRSAGHPRLFSEVTRDLPRAEKDRILARHYHPHRERVRAAAAARAPCLHVSVHTFTPVLDGKARAVDVGVLYDPAREPEASLARALARCLQTRLEDLRVRRNTPYRGAADGLTTALRRVFPPRAYAGLELEVSQGLDARTRRRVAAATAHCLAEAT